VTSVADVTLAVEPSWLGTGPLFRDGGVALIDDHLIDPYTFAQLGAEAQLNYADATRQVCGQDNGDDWRGGYPARALSSAGGGPVQDALYASPQLHELLSDVCGGPIRPSGNRGSYSYYVEPGDFLGLHLDILTCDVTLITVLSDSSPPGGGSLAVRRTGVGVALSTLRAMPDPVEDVIKAPAGQHIVILGGMVPHRVLPLVPGGQRVISALCFEACASK
jgi:hypothetical protein